MNFFQHQDAARKRTTLLVVLLAAAVLCLVVMTVLVIGIFLYFLQTHTTSIDAINAHSTGIHIHFLNLIQSPLTLWIAVGVLATVMMGSLYKWLQMKGGGRTVAEALGARLLDPGSTDPLERKALNVVEEMAIASGNPVPPVYLVEEDSINAFAAGLDRRDAIIGLTNGCITYLTRDELQGVIAHEFSHIHNGDMRLNMKLIAILHGILMIGLVGGYIARSGGTRHGFSGRNRGNGKQVSLGLALMAIGYGGTVFGNLIKAAVSRQREFLADASAVQFTRNPAGISGALKKLGATPQGSTLSSTRAAEFSHFYFGAGIGNFLGGIMATHPPLSDRIRRVDPRWDGVFTETAAKQTATDEPSVPAPETSTPLTMATLASAIELVGDPSSEQIASGDTLIAGLPQVLYEAAHQAFSARALIYGLLLDKVSETREIQLLNLKHQAHPATYRELFALLKHIRPLPRDEYFTLINLCIPALKQQSQPQFQVFKRNLQTLIKASSSVSMFQWCLHRLVIKNIAATSRSGTTPLKQLTDEARRLLHIVAASGGNNDVLGALNAGMKILGAHESKALPASAVNFANLDASLDRLEKLTPLHKPRLLKAIAIVIEYDNKATPTEVELFRVIADTLDCPVPPLFNKNDR